MEFKSKLFCPFIIIRRAQKHEKLHYDTAWPAIIHLLFLSFTLAANGRPIWKIRQINHAITVSVGTEEGLGIEGEPVVAYCLSK